VEQQRERDYEGNPERWKKESASEHTRTVVLEFGEQCVEQLPLLSRSHNGLGFFPPNEVLPYCIGKSIGSLYYVTMRQKKRKVCDLTVIVRQHFADRHFQMKEEATYVLSVHKVAN
jgi:hypothetical protein